MPAPARRLTSCWRANSSAAGVSRPRPPSSRAPDMSQPPRPRGLGRGLSALLGDEDVAATVASQAEAPRPAAGARTPLTLPIANLRAGQFQPRTTFDDIDVLVESVRQFGLLQPILVRPIYGQPN